MLEDIRNNFTKLIALYEEQKQRADILSDRLSQSEKALAIYKEQITELNSQIDNLKLSSAFTGGADNALAKKRLEKLIREIDNCISFLED